MTQSTNLLSDLSSGAIFAPAGSNITIAEWTAQGTHPGEKPEKITPLHRHLFDDEAWYVLEGTLHFTVGREMIEATAGNAVIIPKGTPHAFWNPSREDAKYLIIMTEQIKDLINAIHAADQKDHDSMKKLYEHYESEILE